MNILVLANLYPPFHHGGCGLHCQWYSEGLANRGHEVRVITSIPGPDEIGQGDQGNLDVRRCLLKLTDDLPLTEVFTRTLHNTRAVRRVIRRCRPDIVYCHGIDGIGFNSYHAATESGVPSFTTVGDSWLAQAWSDLPQFDRWCGIATGGCSRGFGKFVRKSFGAIGSALGLYCGQQPARFHPVGAISRFLSESLLRSAAPAAGMISVIPPMLHQRYFKSDGSPIGHSGQRLSHLRALFVGRIEPMKGPDTAIRALAAARRHGADVRLSFAGLHIQTMQPTLEELARSLGVSDQIDWLGTPEHDELVRIYQAHDVFLFPSRIVEGFGLVNAEAMACGLPVVGTAHSGSADVIVNWATGFRIVKDDCEAIGSHLDRLWRDRALLEVLSAGAIRAVRRFHPAGVVDQLERALFDVAGCHRTAFSSSSLGSAPAAALTSAGTDDAT